MSDIAQSIRTYLLTKTGVTDLVQTRIYPGAFKQDTLRPSITMWTVYGSGIDDLKGFTGFHQATLRIEALSEDFTEANETSKQVSIALNDLGRGVFDGIHIDSIWQSSTIFNLADRPFFGDDRWFHRSIQSFDVNYHLFER